ncbi:MAG: 3D domain-containing protein [candidate division WOR-3 bacterium]|nr:3D domain-containing protein [candidate division WOR-3 bacterium]
MSKWFVFTVFLFSGCLGPQVNTAPVSGTWRPPPAWLYSGIEGKTGTARYLGRFKVTYYWVVEESDYPKSRSTPLYTIDGKLLGRFSSAFVKDFKTESAARLRDGRCISYLKGSGRVKVVDRFLGHGGFTLTELKSIAVDPEIIPLGSKLYIPQFEGVSVNGRQLNGVFYAHDIGGAVKGKHIDVFIGKREYMNFLSSAGVKSSGFVDIYLLE